MSLRIDVITLFPQSFPGPLAESIPGRALARGLAELRSHDLRQWGLGRYRAVDDAPYGGGAGMVLRPEPIAAALDALRGPDGYAVLLDPGGAPFDQRLARQLAAREHLLLVCPRYEGVDDRVRSLVDLELSIGDYVLSGGELAALVVVDAVLRLLPGAIGDASVAEESFTAGLLEYPQYTRPAEFRGLRVPQVLVSGDHGAVARWRQEQALERTRRMRPDLLTGNAGHRDPPGAEPGPLRADGRRRSEGTTAARRRAKPRDARSVEGDPSAASYDAAGPAGGAIALDDDA